PLTYQWLFGGNPIPGATSNSYTIAPVLAGNLGTYSVQVRNPLGTATSADATLGIGDFTPPALQCPTGVSAACAGPNGTPVTFNASANDNCDGALPVTCNPPSGSAFPAGQTTVNCSATDSHSNKGTCSFVVTVTDTKA